MGERAASSSFPFHHDEPAASSKSTRVVVVVAAAAAAVSGRLLLRASDKPWPPTSSLGCTTVIKLCPFCRAARCSERQPPPPPPPQCLLIWCQPGAELGVASCLYMVGEVVVVVFVCVFFFVFVCGRNTAFARL